MYPPHGSSAEAVKLDEETLRIRERVLRPEHPDTLRTRGNLGQAYRNAGREDDVKKVEAGWTPGA